MVIFGALRATALRAFDMTSGVFPTTPRELFRCSYLSQLEGSVDGIPLRTMHNGTVLFPKIGPTQEPEKYHGHQWQELDYYSQRGSVRNFRPVQDKVPLLTVNWVRVSLPVFFILVIFVCIVSMSG